MYAYVEQEPHVPRLRICTKSCGIDYAELVAVLCNRYQVVIPYQGLGKCLLLVTGSAKLYMSTRSVSTTVYTLV